MGARYHLKPDGTSGVCTAQEGNCPFGEHTPHGSQAFVKAMHERQESIRAKYTKRGLSKSYRRKGVQSDLNNLNNGTMSETFGNLNVLFGEPNVNGDVDLDKVDFVRYETYDKDGDECTMDIYKDGTILTHYDPSTGKEDNMTEYNTSSLRQSMEDSRLELKKMYVADKRYQREQSDFQVSLKRDLGLMAVWNKEKQEFELQDFADQDAYRETHKVGDQFGVEQYNPTDPNVMEKVNMRLATLTGMRRAKEHSKESMDRISGGIKETLGMTGVLRSGSKSQNIVMGTVDEDGGVSIITCSNDSWVGSNPSILGASKASAFQVIVDPPRDMSSEDIRDVIQRANRLSSTKDRRKLFEENGFTFSNEAVPMNPVYGDSLGKIGERYDDPNKVQSAMASLAVTVAKGEGVRGDRRGGLSKDEWESAMQVYAVAGSEDFQPSTLYDVNGRMADMHSMVTIEESGNYKDNVRHIMENLDHDAYAEQLSQTISISPSVSYYSGKNGETVASNLECAMVGDRMVFPVCMQANVREPYPGVHKSYGVSRRKEPTITSTRPKDENVRKVVRSLGEIVTDGSTRYEAAEKEWESKGRICPDCGESLDGTNRCKICDRVHPESRLLARAYKLAKSGKGPDYGIFKYLRPYKSENRMTKS